MLSSLYDSYTGDGINTISHHRYNIAHQWLRWTNTCGEGLTLIPSKLTRCHFIPNILTTMANTTIRTPSWDTVNTPWVHVIYKWSSSTCDAACSCCSAVWNSPFSLDICTFRAASSFGFDGGSDSSCSKHHMMLWKNKCMGTTSNSRFKSYIER